MERKIGEIFEFGGEWYQCMKELGCDNCDFLGTKYCSYFECSPFYRVDKTPVIFKKLEKVGEPYMDGGKIMQKYKRVYREPIYFPYKELNCYNDLHGRICIEIKQTKEDMEEKNNGNTPLNVLTDKYVNGDICYDDFEKEVKELYSCKEEIKPTLKEFDLEAAKLGKPVCTRDGRKARIICFDRDDLYPIVALIGCEDGKEIIGAYSKEGKTEIYEIKGTDLMMLPEKRSGWAKVRKDINLYDTKEDADRKMIGNDEYVTAKVCWEE